MRITLAEAVEFNRAEARSAADRGLREMSCRAMKRSVRQAGHFVLAPSKKLIRSAQGQVVDTSVIGQIVKRPGCGN